MSERLRILLVLSELETDWLGGIGRVTSAMACSLALRGHEVHMAGRARGDGAPGELPGVHLHPWPTSSKIAQLPALLKLAREIGPDVVHFHSGLPHGDLMAGFRLARWTVDRPLIACTPHTGARWDVPKLRSKLGLRTAELIVAPCEWTARQARRWGAAPERTHVVWSGVDEVAKACDDARSPTIVAMARMVPRKGLDLAIDAFGKVSARWPEWRLVIGGRGPQLEPLRARVAKRGLPVDLPGFISGPGKTELLRSASIAVVPSRSDMIPGTLLEFQAMGLPVIATDVGGIREAADGGHAAYLVDADDVDALARGLEALMADPALRRRLSAGALAVSAGRSWPRLAGELEATYLHSLGRTAILANA